MPSETDLRAAIRELADRARPLSAPADEPAPSGRHRPRRRQLAVISAVIAVGAVIALAVKIEHGAAPRPAAGTGCARGQRLTEFQCAAALRLGHDEANRVSSGHRPNDPTRWPANIDIVTVGVRDGTELEPNAGPPCTSGRILSVELIGDFQKIVVAPPPLQAGGKQPDLSVHGVDIEADAATGRACLIGVQTGHVEPRAGTTILYRANQK